MWVEGIEIMVNQRERIREVLLGIRRPYLHKNHCDRLDLAFRQKFERRGGLLFLRRSLWRVSCVSPGSIRDCKNGRRRGWTYFYR